ncbi:uncharacterized protein LACBIDRAFT_329631 [Laccaria bicolor S238N-H82]|uniref:Predicted protein n=1 Tax=Laccaria bicolor (strain S238N-H82 / ATCC MYA-4686) TaxID=486041 RepID=B0DIN1_LACBS|nr:uncharacterized protein LACBIDRAFT_329631 [Laccaria bicolor S238N-H82]EDR05600.1 predicted protein [Laccaria bicolor S238N-H82]|eukprot:XP_001883704.1 predicted protein [Laccaria bicolor S238N-H82]
MENVPTLPIFLSWIWLTSLPLLLYKLLGKLVCSLPVTGNSQTFNSKLKMLCIQILAWRNIDYVKKALSHGVQSGFVSPFVNKSLYVVNSFSHKEFVWSFEYGLNTILEVPALHLILYTYVQPITASMGILMAYTPFTIADIT